MRGPVAGGKGQPRELSSSSHVWERSMQKLQKPNRKSDGSEWYHPVRAGFEKNSLPNPVDGYPLPGRIQVCYC